MTENAQYIKTYETYCRMFPNAMMFGSRGMAGEDFDNLEQLMLNAIERGSTMTQDDLKFPVLNMEPEAGLFT
jgi:hypothetical protein